MDEPPVATDLKEPDSLGPDHPEWVVTVSIPCLQRHQDRVSQAERGLRQHASGKANTHSLGG